MKNKYGFCKGLAALVLLMLCALTIKDNAYAQTAKSYYLLETVIHIIMICQIFLRE